MARGTRRRLTGAVPLTFFALPVADGVLAYDWTTAAPSCALRSGSGRIPTASSSSPVLPVQGLSQRRLGESGDRRDGLCSVRSLRRARGGVRSNRSRDGSAVQMTASDSAVVELSINSLGAGEATRRRQQQQQQQDGDDNDLAGSGRVSADCRLRRGLRNLGRLRQPQNVLELLAVARGRGETMNLRVFNAAITAVAPCEEGCRYALRLLVLMQEERIAPDRFTLTAIVASCFRCQKWDVAHGVLQTMQRQGMRPLDMRASRLTTAPGDAGEARDRVLRLLRHLRSTEGEEGVRLASPPSALPEQRTGGPGSGSGGGDDGVSGQGGPRQRDESGTVGKEAVRGKKRMVVTGAREAQLGRSGEVYAQQQQQQQQRRRRLLNGDGGETKTRAGAGAGAGAGLSNDKGRRGSAAEAGERHAGGGAAAAVVLEAAGGEKTVEELMAAGMRPPQEAFLSELKKAANTKSWNRALELLDGLREAGFQPLPGAYACAMRACGKAGKWEHSLALMDEMRSRGVEPGEGCNVMALKACADAGLWEKTLGMLKSMRASGVNRSESTFVVAMKACGDAGQWEKALALMDDMRRDGMPPMETTYTTAMKACGSTGEWEQTLKLFYEMQSIGIPPTEQCYTAAIRACAKADKTEKAYSLLLKMRAAQGVKTNLSSYRAVMHAHCRAGDWASALGLLEDARRDQIKPGTGDLRAMVEACGKAEQHERALSLLEEMRSEGMNLRRTGEKLWWVFDNCRDKQVKDRAWLLMEVEETRERLRLRAERNAQKAEAAEAAAVATA
ncbi:unnamed protein product [Pylaiella littoralis]